MMLDTNKLGSREEIMYGFGGDAVYRALFELEDEAQNLREQIRYKNWQVFVAYALIILTFVGLSFFTYFVKDPFLQSVLVEVTAGTAMFIVMPAFLSMGEKYKWKVVRWSLFIFIVLLIWAWFSTGLLESVLVEFSTGLLLAAILNLAIKNYIIVIKSELLSLNGDLSGVEEILPK